jgi:ATP-dependent HslUV protease subunit HslV
MQRLSFISPKNLQIRTSPWTFPRRLFGVTKTSTTSLKSTSRSFDFKCCYSNTSPFWSKHALGWDLGDGKFHGTTILTVRKNNKVVVIGDGQVTLGSERVKVNAKKLRRMAGDKIVVGFAGGVTDALALCEKLEQQVEKCNGQLLRAAVEMSKAWRMDKFMHRLEATLIVVDKDVSLTISGGGELVEHTDGIQGIGSGGGFAKAAARALIDQPLEAEQIARKAMKIAADMCVYTSDHFVVEIIDGTPQVQPPTTTASETPSSSSPSPTSTTEPPKATTEDQPKTEANK